MSNELPPRRTRLYHRLRWGRYWKSTKCLFLLHTGRVGSVTAIKLLDLSPHVYALHEPSLLESLTPKYACTDPEEYAARYGAVFAKTFAKARQGTIGMVGGSHRAYAESFWTAYFGLEVAKLLPLSRFVHLHRHPGEYVRSGMRRGWYVDHAWDVRRLEPSPSDPVYKLWHTEWDAFRKIAWLWQTMNAYFLKMRESVPEDRFAVMRSEDFYRFGTGAYRRLFDLLDVPPPPEDEARTLLSVRHNAQTKGDFPPYEEWTSEQRQILRDIAGPMMERLGYE